MRGWTVAVAMAGVLAWTEGRAFQPWIEPVAPEVSALQAKLSAVQEDLARLEEEQALHAEAERLGVVEAVAASRLPVSHQRRVAVAIVRESRRNGVDPLLVTAVIRCESAFHAYAVSPVGALGLMQVMPDTGRWLAERWGMEIGRTTHLFDTELNIELGTAYLADLIQRFGTLEAALVAYNAGPGLARWILAQPAARTRFLAGYPAKVLGEYRKLQASSRRPAPSAPQADKASGS